MQRECELCGGCGYHRHGCGESPEPREALAELSKMGEASLAAWTALTMRLMRCLDIGPTALSPAFVAAHDAAWRQMRHAWAASE